MFNTIGRCQGWSDTPLTKAGEEGIRELGRGFKAKGIKFDRSYSSDSGRTIQTMGFIKEASNHPEIPYKMDKRIREWCFGSFDGAYDGELFGGVLPRIFKKEGATEGRFSFEKTANAIYEVDTAGWAETWEQLSTRIIEGFTDIAKESEEAGAKNIVIVSHGLTIATFLGLLRQDLTESALLDNGSVTHLIYENGQFQIGQVGDMSYREAGKR